MPTLTLTAPNQIFFHKHSDFFWSFRSQQPDEISHFEFTAHSRPPFVLLHGLVTRKRPTDSSDSRGHDLKHERQRLE